ncbi:MAG: hypothetical protein A3A80_03420 [Candidatus Terrybacteria bacterium RIFCSPLOWO2_01_FULL_44_24]|uniref:Vitamin K epoxide reductase domain-containing protein n=1 Tax=Candidatus Terrybacteria bacterium RIFCSPHIGHO2_01_FULL_43_35 TaxID=1802361 RepID=A0A1G2PDI3_9BACT|nr:MAG: hypothetical protein A2828_00335 [Candidatus Terrybacteria bacterium RIFCSPHIGHO2_01_FULL_43_35]OHA49735.1 MAG: hypothetical protein A3B75_01910 [Candidatus Terrybacteria bacterium RIFCSPHIGHO2_02_FULL_43_14]OHA51558.1 MAG: hypothetical protein A3A80_03420 [Candidatus Terrybacteria bacterium RIFCSPLOWO2_01_FULL_44_24]
MKIRTLVSFLSALGVVISVYALYQHYGPVGTAFCNISDKFSCDLVNKSSWSEIGGMPVALFGIIGYAAIFILTLHRPASWEKLLVIFTILGFLFSLYLTYLEAFVILVWCIICLASIIIMTALTLLSVRIWQSAK